MSAFARRTAVAGLAAGGPMRTCTFLLRPAVPIPDLRLPPMSSSAPLKVLILCSGPSARGIIAEHVLRAKGCGRFEVTSAGTESSGPVHPLALWVLKERFNLDAIGARLRSLAEVQGIAFDCVLTVCDTQMENCPVWPGMPILAHWGSPDPEAIDGTERQMRRVFLNVALQIGRRADLLCALPPHQFEPFRVQEIGRLEAIEDVALLVR